MKHFLILFLFMSLIPIEIDAQTEVTFSEHIAPIIYNNCAECHRSGEIGPFPLTNYEEAKPWAEMIKYVTNIRYMPPWKADPQYSRFLGERFLSQEDIDLITEWADNGAPQGNPDLEPDLPEFATGSQVGTPDLVLSFEQSFEHYGGNKDEYRVFVLPTGLTEDQEIATIELRPGNRKIVHHALFAIDTEGQGRALDAQDEKYGYDGFGGFGFNGWLDKMLPGYVPGQKPVLSPEGTGQTLPSGADILVQMHYAPIPVPDLDSSTVNVFFKKEPVERNIESVILLPFFPYIQNGPFFMFANTVREFHCSYEFDEKVSLISVWPHAHLLGQNWTVYIEHENGDTTHLISIPEWDFNWQGAYYFKRYIIVEPGDVLHGYATYDNTIANPSNPNNPPQFVTWGEGTTDEMFFLPVTFVPYNEGDEDVVFDENVTTSIDPELHFANHTFLPIYPNPSSDVAHAAFHMAARDNVNIRLIDLEGKVIQTLTDQMFEEGLHKVNLNTTGIPNGAYFLQMRATNFNRSQKLMIKN